MFNEISEKFKTLICLISIKQQQHNNHKLNKTTTNRIIYIIITRQKIKHTFPHPCFLFSSLFYYKQQQHKENYKTLFQKSPE